MLGSNATLRCTCVFHHVPVDLQNLQLGWELSCKSSIDGIGMPANELHTEAGSKRNLNSVLERRPAIIVAAVSSHKHDDMLGGLWIRREKNRENGALHVCHKGIVDKALALSWDAFHKVCSVAELLPYGLAVAWPWRGADDNTFCGCWKVGSCYRIETWNELFLNVDVGSVNEKSINNKVLLM